MTTRYCKAQVWEIVTEFVEPNAWVSGDDPFQQLMRQIIVIFREYTSRENGRNVTRVMLKSAKK